jgi:hypothetical protein
MVQEISHFSYGQCGKVKVNTELWHDGQEGEQDTR